MRTGQLQEYNALRDTTMFLDTHGNVLPRTNASGVRLHLDALARQFSIDAGLQAAEAQAYHDAVRQAGALRTRLFTAHLAPLAAALRVVAVTTPALLGIWIPASSAGHHDVLAAARCVGEAVRPIEPQVVAAGLAPDFLAQLRTAIIEMAHAMSAVNRHLTARVSATVALAEHTRRARRLRRLVDRQVRSDLGAGHPLLVQWTEVRPMTKTHCGSKAP